MSGMTDQERAQKWFEETRRLHMNPNPDLHKVVAGYRKSLTFNPNDPQVLYHLGLALLGRREWTNAEEQFRKALRLQPAMATNPYFRFHIRVLESGILDFDWYDTSDLTFAARAAIAVP